MKNVVSNFDDSMTTTIGCVLQLFVFTVYIIIATWSVNYSLMVIFGKTLPFIVAVILGVIAGEFTIPMALVIFILKYYHIL